MDDAFNRVVDRQTFFEFVQALIKDRTDEVSKEQAGASSVYGPGANGWEHGTIEDFLFAALRWAEGSGELSAEPSWKSFATFLYCGKVYE